MRWKRLLRFARNVSFVVPACKQHIVVCAAMNGKQVLQWFWNTPEYHAEDRALQTCPEADRLVVFRFNRADLKRDARPSGPCAACSKLIQKSGVRKVEYLSTLGPVVNKVQSYVPYNKDWRAGE